MKHMKQYIELNSDLCKRYPMVFTHQDVREDNIIYDSKTGMILTLKVLVATIDAQ